MSLFSKRDAAKTALDTACETQRDQLAKIKRDLGNGKHNAADWQRLSDADDAVKSAAAKHDKTQSALNRWLRG